MTGVRGSAFLCLVRSAALGTFRRKWNGNGNISRQFATSQSLFNVSKAQEENRKARVDLAASYRALEELKLHEGVCNHLTMMAPAESGEGEVMLLIPYGMHWSEVTASSLVGLNDKNEVVEGDGHAEISAATIHRGVHDSRKDATCVFHIHPPYATTLACLTNPTIRNAHQNNARFHKRVSYDKNYNGLSTAVEEGRRLATVLGNKDILMMGNHGVLVTGSSAAIAFDEAYYFERACMFQVLAMSTGEQIADLSDEQSEGCVKQYIKILDEYATAHFDAWKRLLLKKDPCYKD